MMYNHMKIDTGTKVVKLRFFITIIVTVCLMLALGVTSEFPRRQDMAATSSITDISTWSTAHNTTDAGKMTQSPVTQQPPQTSVTKLDGDIASIFEQINSKGYTFQKPVTADFLKFHNENTDPRFVEKLKAGLEENSYENEIFYNIFGSTLLTLYDKYEQKNDSHIISFTDSKLPSVLTFAGDVNLSDDSKNMKYLKSQNNDITKCLSEPLLNRMRAADLFMVNNEFAFSNRGAPLKGKTYTFRSKPENVKYLQEMGVDIVSLANNHAFDYGETAFYDTMDTLKDAGIEYVGGGSNLQEASKTQYYIINGVKIAIVAGSRVERIMITPGAKENSPGVFRMLDPALFLEKIKEAKSNADFVIAYVHWGVESTYTLEQFQKETGKKIIDSGADIIIGCHPHVLQGIEYYKGKPIIYSLGNFWFSAKKIESALLEVTIKSPNDISIAVEPCLQSSTGTKLLTAESERKKVFDLLVSISPSKITFDKDGVITAG